MAIDENRFAKSEHEYRTIVRQTLTKLQCDQAIFDDIVQEAMTDAWKGRDKGPDDPEEVRFWLYTLARNCWKRHYRYENQEKRRAPVESFFEDVHSIREDYRTGNPLDRLILDEQQKELHALLKSLPPKRAQIVKQYYFYDLSLKEIAARTNLALGTIKAQLSQARRQLEKCYKRKKSSTPEKEAQT